MIEKKNADRRNDRGVKASNLRCAACLLIQDCTLKDFRCTLTRCPHMFVEIRPPTGSQPGVRVEGLALRPNLDGRA